MIRDLVLVGIGSGIGGICRYLISLLMPLANNSFPWGTFTANIVGCLLIGILWGVTSRLESLAPTFSLFLMVGFCGGFTTFSTFSLEAFNLFDNKQYAAGSIYVILSCGCCILGILCGKKIASVIKF